MRTRRGKDFTIPSLTSSALFSFLLECSAGNEQDSPDRKEGVKPAAAIPENSFTFCNFAAASTSISAYLPSLFSPVTIINPSPSSTSTFGQA